MNGKGNIRYIRFKDAVGVLFVAVFLLLGAYGVYDILKGGDFEAVAGTASAEEETSVVIRRVPGSARAVALTFDDGPHPVYTAEILDILSKYNIKATFFVIGTNAETYPELVERELAEGHEVENHTLNHLYLQKESSAKIKEEMIENQTIISAITKYRTKFLRPPGGLFDERLSEIAKQLDYKIVLWSVDTCDWNHPTPENIAENVLEDIRGGDIILMHDYIVEKSPTPVALELMLPRLIERGFEFVTISELLENSGREALSDS